MELQFTNEGSNLRATLSGQNIKITSHSISGNEGSGFQVDFEVVETTDPQNSVVFEGYNFEQGGSSNYEAVVHEGGSTPPLQKPPGGVVRI